MKVFFYAQSRAAAGADHILINTGFALTQTELWERLIAAQPQLATYHRTARLARNESYLQDGEVLQPDDEIAVIPPVSGG